MLLSRLAFQTPLPRRLATLTAHAFFGEGGWRQSVAQPMKIFAFEGLCCKHKRNLVLGVMASR